MICKDILENEMKCPKCGHKSLGQNDPSVEGFNLDLSEQDFANDIQYGVRGFVKK